MTTITKSAEHLHNRPTWDCRICKQPWPCDSAKSNLLAEFRGFPSTLTIYLSGKMYDALKDLDPSGRAASTDMYDRFVSWSHHDD